MDIKSLNNYRFITFEGIEGSGKTTQIKLLAEYFKQQGKQVLCLREPGGTLFGEKLREAILSSETPLHPLAEAHLFAASRAQLLKEKVLPFLDVAKQIVIIDRYIDSSFAYQGHARGLGLNTIEEIHTHAPLNKYPDITFYLDISTEVSFQRQNERGNAKDYFEQEKEDFYQKLIEGFELCCQKFPQRLRRINAEQSPQQIHEKIKELLNESK